MKKKRNFLTIISSLFGVVAICGLSLFSLLDHKKESQKVEAASIQNISSYSSEGSFSSYGADYAFIIDYDYTVDYNQYLDGGNNYYALHLVFNFHFFIDNDNQPYEIFVYDESKNDFTIDLTTSYLSVFEPSLYYELDVRLGVAFESTLSNGVYSNILKQFWLVVRTFPDDETVSTLTNNDIKYSSPVSVYDDDDLLLNIDMENFNTMVNRSDFSDHIFEASESNYNLGFNDGYQAGFNDGYMNGSSNGYSSGYDQGKTDAELVAQEQIANAYQNGYSTGYNEGLSVDSTVAGIFSGILQVAMVPVNFFLAVFNFEILGINLSAFIRAIFTVVLTIIVMKTVLGKGGGSNDN